ncbi:MAG: penicillin acylase family protein [Acetobacteraceae bacterium]|nr:penicillin acylase family protein [Acetobacteraceae bacterium]
MSEPRARPTEGRAARLRRWASRFLLGTVALVASGVGMAALAIWWATPPGDDRLTIAGLAGPVTIQRDPDGIPWIKASTETDAATALGYMHARDRMFQMELMRRAASGRLSELAGPVTLRLDRTNRALGLRRRAEAELATLDPATRAMLDAYARGVNAFVGQRGRFASPEFLLLGAPERWTPVDSLLWGKTMAQYLAGNWRTELTRAALAPKLSPAVQRALWPTTANAAGPGAILTVPTRLAELVPDFPAPFTQPDEASNEWAVDGSHTVSGAPLVAGDPHLALTFPSIWYLARVDTPGHALVGAFAPGIPFLVIGHNGTLAWTFTTTGADTQDIFVETPLADGTYATPSGPQPFTTRHERIRVRGAPDDELTVRETRHGPVLSDLDRAAPQILAISMASLMVPDTSAAGLLALNHAATLDEAGRAGAAITAPVQNLLVADRLGIAQFTTGRVPLRRAGDGSVPVAGADGAHDWTGFAGGEALPRRVHPTSGRIVNANEPVAGPDFPVFMGAEQFGDWRARRIDAMLDARPKHDRAGFAAMQVDVVSDVAEEILPALLATRPADAASGRVLALLRSWDGSMRRDLPQPLAFNMWIRQFRTDVLASLDIPDAPVGPPVELAGEALARGGTALCGGDCGPLLTQSLSETAAALPAGWEQIEWGTRHQAVFSHPLLGNLPLVGADFTWSIPQPGDDSTVFRGGMRLSGYSSVHGPAFRGVYDLADLDESLFGLAPGESGNPFSTHAASTLRRWRDGVPIRLGPAPETVDRTIELLP